MTKEQTNSWEDELEKYVRENCSLHILGLLGQNPDDPITSKDFRYIVTFIEQIISERDKKWQKEKSELEYKLYMKTDKMYQILTQLENCLHILGKIESQKEHYPTVQDYLDGDESLQAMWRSYRD